MRQLKVNLTERSYPIYFSEDSLLPVLENHFPDCRIFIITNPILKTMYSSWIGEIPNSECIVVPDGEMHKTLETYELLQSELITRGADRKSVVLAFGGGVIGDLAGFVAATYMRGIPLIQIPTSLLAMVDSSVGGKTGVNHALGKNIIGAFYQPSLVYINPNFLDTLPPREYLCGMAEVIKYGCIADPDFFEKLENSHRIEKKNRLEILYACCRIKAAVVEMDEKETGLRMVLNFGHTWAHALESLSGYGLLKHGEAVMIGMLAASQMSLRCDRLGQSEYDRVEKLLAMYINEIMSNLEILEFFRSLKFEDVYRKMKSDKKSSYGKIKWVLLNSVGSAEVVIVDSEKIIQDSFDYARQFLMNSN